MNDVLMIAGCPGTGKSTITSILADEFHLRTVNVADLLQNRLAAIGVVPSLRADIGPLFLDHFSTSEIFRLIELAIEQENENVFDGVRLAETCHAVRTKYAKAVIWLVRAGLSTRLRRVREKLKSETNQSMEPDIVLKRHSMFDEEENKILQLADVVIDNEYSLQELRERVRSEFLKSQLSNQSSIKKS